ncbi:uncharacterized protein [Amphiura filiformis]|uniref:uncharacterized protein n=1 Tax=Amphiura filiformis TaxID=82378 RepID=UPI003B2148E4
MGGEASKSGNSAAAKEVVRDHRFDLFLSKVTKEEQPGSEILKPTFVNQFPDFAENLAETFFNHIAQTNINPEHASISLEVINRQQCYQAFLQVQSLTSTQSQLEFYIRVFCGTDGLTEKGVHSLLETAYIISMRTNGTFHKWTEIEQTVIKELAHTIVSKGSQSSALSWMDTNCPNLVAAMHLFFLTNIYRGKDEEHSTNVTNSEIFEGRLLSMTRWWILTSTLPSCFSQSQGQSEQVDGASASASGDKNKEVAEEYHWSILYSSEDHGLSLNRFKHHVFGYRGPTVLILRCDGDYVYAVAIDVEWRDGIQPWGGANCHIIRISPDFQILEDGDNMVVFNDKSRNIPKGVWIGRDSRNRKLHIEEGFETVTHNFQTSRIKCMEVWGCGDPSAKTAQSKQKKTELRDAEKHSKVKLPGHWDENPDKMILDWGGVKVNHAEYAYDARK